jgi:epoxyqueuosine reductase
MNFGNALKERAKEIGFDLVGVAPSAAWRDLEFAHHWVERGFGGEMDYLSNPKRHDPRSVLPSVKSIICVGLVYNAPLPYSTEVQVLGFRIQEPGVRSQEGENQSEIRSAKIETRHPSYATRHLSQSGRFSNFEFRISHAAEGPRAWISRYAWGRDYHEVMRLKLERLRAAVEALAPGAETRIYVDTGPIVERAFARISGIGWMGKNTCLINQEKGSWFFLGVVLTNLALAPDLPAPDRCGSCTRCLEACPTGALVEPYVMDASRCIAYFNIELKGSVPAQFREAIGANVFGCDICQDVCPWNGESRSQKSEGRSKKLEVRSQKLEDRRQKSGVRSQNRSNVRGARAAATTELPEFQPLQIEFPSPESLAPSPFSPGPQPLVPSPCFQGPQPPVPDPCSPTRGHSAPNPEPRIPLRLIAQGGERSRTANPESRTLTFSLFNPPLSALAEMSEVDFRRAFAHSPIKRVKYRGWLRNLCVAMGNSSEARFVPKLRELAAHADPIVREHAQWAIKTLTKYTSDSTGPKTPEN